VSDGRRGTPEENPGPIRDVERNHRGTEVAELNNGTGAIPDGEPMDAGK